MTRFFTRIATSKTLGLAFKLALTLAAFAYVFATIDTDQLSHIFAEQDHGALIGAALLMLTQLFLGALRWRMIMVAIAGNDKTIISWRDVARFYYISAFFNCCLPGTVGGDVVRVMLAKSERFSMSQSIYSVLLDRVLSIVALFVLILIMLPTLAEIMGFAPLPVFFLSLLATGAGIMLVVFFDRLFMRFSRFRIIQLCRHFIECLMLLWRHKTTSLLSLFYGVLAHTCYAMSGLLIAGSLGIEISAAQALALLPLVLLVSMLPISIGGWGVREASMVSMLALIGVAKPLALVLSIQLGLLIILLSLPAGLLWLTTRKHNPQTAQ